MIFVRSLIRRWAIARHPRKSRVMVPHGMDLIKRSSLVMTDGDNQTMINRGFAVMLAAQKCRNMACFSQSISRTIRR